MTSSDARKVGRGGPLAALGRLPPRWLAAAWFGVWGFLTSATLFVGWPPVGDVERMVLFGLLPGLAAAGGGAVVGRSLLDVDDGLIPRGIGLGVLAAVIAHVLFAPLFAGAMWILELWDGVGGHANLVGTTVATLVLGPVLAGGLTLGVGALAGGLLAFLWSRVDDRAGR